MFDPRAKRLDPVVGERVIAEERIFLFVVEHLLVPEVVEEADEPPSRHAGGLQVGRGSLVGAGLLLSGIAKSGYLAEIARGEDQPSRCIGCPGESRQMPRPTLSNIGPIAARVMPQTALSVRRQCDRFHERSPDQLVWRLGLEDQSRVEKQVLTAGGEGVQFLVRDDVDLDAFRFETGRDEDRIPRPGAGYPRSRCPG